MFVFIYGEMPVTTSVMPPEFIAYYQLLENHIYPPHSFIIPPNQQTSLYNIILSNFVGLFSAFRF